MLFGKLKQIESASIERRQAVRKLVCFASRLSYPGCDFLINRTVCDFSPMGAGITLETQQPIPDLVHLVDFRSLLVYEAPVAWRKSPEFGLQFLRMYRSKEALSETLRTLIYREVGTAPATQ